MMRYLLVIFILCKTSYSLDNGLALAPPMGWLSWERFRCITDCKEYPTSCISEYLIKSIADSLVSEGYRAAGYEYVIIDDCWLAHQRVAEHKLKPDTKRFPAGFKQLVQQLHSKNLKFGVYEDVGHNTCKGYPGSFGHYKLDAATFASWGVDYVKFDGCAINKEHLENGYKEMGYWMNQTGHPMVYSCEWPLAAHNRGTKVNMTEVASVCNTFRVARDIQDSWESVITTINYIGKHQEEFLSVSGPGAWTDADQLLIGDFGLSPDQERVQMGMWAIMASPLLISADVRNLRPESKELLLNPRVLALSQDRLGIPGKRILMLNNHVQVWRRLVMPQGSYAIALIYTKNPGYPIKVHCKLEDFKLQGSRFNVTEVFDGYFLGIFHTNDSLKLSINPTGIFLMKATLIV